MNILDYIKSVYRLALDGKIKAAGLTRGIAVVEFYLEGDQYFIDIDNRVYIQDRSKTSLHGIEVGYLKDSIIYIGSLFPIKN
jgi:hypothetical protein